METRKNLFDARAKLRIAAGCVANLAVGAWLRPPSAPTDIAPPQEKPAPLLNEQVQLREVPRPFRGVQDVLPLDRRHAVGIPRSRSVGAVTRNDFVDAFDETAPAGFGVFVSDSYMLTHASATGGRTSLQVGAADGRMIDARFAAYEPATGLVLFETASLDQPPVTMASEPMSAGALAIALGAWLGREIALPVFVTSVGLNTYRVGGGGAAILPGMPIYNLDQELFAVMGTEGEAFPVQDAARRLIERATAGVQRSSFGIAVQALEGPLAGIFGAEGALVNHVVEGGPAEQAGVQPGDVLTGVGDATVQTADDAVEALRSTPIGAPVTLRTRRIGKVHDIEVTPALAYVVAALDRAASDDPGRAPEARTIIDRPLLETAGIPGRGRVLSLNGRPVASRSEADREIRRRRGPVPLLIRLDGAQYFAAIEPAR